MDSNQSSHLYFFGLIYVSFAFLHSLILGDSRKKRIGK
jgi:hypothetical protein